MTRSKTFVALTVIGALALASCAGLPNDPVDYVTGLDAAFQVWCAQDKTCNNDMKKKEAAVYQVALDGAKAYDAGTLSQADLDKDIQDLLAAIAQFEKRK